jgi:hypothetical protein
VSGLTPNGRCTRPWWGRFGHRRCATRQPAGLVDAIEGSGGQSARRRPRCGAGARPPTGLRWGQIGTTSWRVGESITSMLASATVESGFSPADFYVAVATLVPVLFLALAVEGRFISNLLEVFSWAEDAWAKLMLAVVLAPFFTKLFKNRAKPSEGEEKKTVLGRFLGFAVHWLEAPDPRGLRARAYQAIIFVGMLVAFMPAVLAGCIIAYGTASEIVAILVLYHQAASPWMGPFVVFGVIFLVVMVAITPAIALLRTAIQALWGSSRASASDPPSTTPHGGES